MHTPPGSAGQASLARDRDDLHFPIMRSDVQQVWTMVGSGLIPFVMLQ